MHESSVDASKTKSSDFLWFLWKKIDGLSSDCLLITPAWSNWRWSKVPGLLVLTRQSALSSSSGFHQWDWSCHDAIVNQSCLQDIVSGAHDCADLPGINRIWKYTPLAGAKIWFDFSATLYVTFVFHDPVASFRIWTPVRNFYGHHALSGNSWQHVCLSVRGTQLVCWYMTVSRPCETRSTKNNPQTGITLFARHK